MNGSRDEALGMLALASGSGLSFRHFPQSKYRDLVWQAGRDVIEAITFADGSMYLLERFELYAWASTSAKLIELLA
jgi:hypothetical protein